MCCLKGMALYVLGDGVACTGLALYVVDAVPHCQKGAVKALWVYTAHTAYTAAVTHNEHAYR